MTARVWLMLIVFGCLACGCARLRTAPALPQRSSLVLDQLVVHSDAPLPKHHRLLDELQLQRSRLSTTLGLAVSDEPIHVYLFPSAEDLDAYMRVYFPNLPERRAFFVETDTRLTVYAYWGDRVAEDLRHEVAHGYLHAVVPRLPLWLDEGLAEYFEVPRGMNGVNQPHVEQLSVEFERGRRPDLRRLEQLADAGAMTQSDYAESWAWVHLLLESTPERRQVLQGYLQSLTTPAETGPLSARVLTAPPGQVEQQLMDHVALLRQSHSR
ncbi:MAG: DUF1570 domain-containing protein [Pirellulales bacterium]